VCLPCRASAAITSFALEHPHSMHRHSHSMSSHLAAALEEKATPPSTTSSRTSGSKPQ
jgi:hypothetical protein